MTLRTHHESDFQTSFNVWCRYNVNHTAAFELKVTPNDHIYFDRLEPHQLSALKSAAHDTQYFRIPDTDYMNKRPYDCYKMCNVKAYVCVMFRNVERGQREFYMIDIDDWERESVKGASLSEVRAKEIGIKCELK